MTNVMSLEGVGLYREVSWHSVTRSQEKSRGDDNS